MSSLSRLLWFRRLVQLLWLSLGILHLLLCPYSKVEESFGIQATHDLYYANEQTSFTNIIGDLRQGLRQQSLSNATLSSIPTKDLWDHLQYPGVVPRTFAGPLVLVTLCRISHGLLAWILSFVTTTTSGSVYIFLQRLLDDPLLVQFQIRLILLLLQTWAWWNMAKAIDVFSTTAPWRNLANTFDVSYEAMFQPSVLPSLIGNYFLLVSMCQFHVLFYASRLLPNVLATWVCVIAYKYWLRQDMTLAARYLTVAVVLLRCDVVLLLATVGVSWLLTRQLTLWKALRIGIMTALVTLAITVPIDSLLWQHWTWPEGVVFYFNTVLGKSSDWGTSPWHWYWTVGLPKALLLTLFFVPLSMVRLPERLAFFLRIRAWRRSKVIDKNRVIPSVVFPPLLGTEWMPFVLPAFGFVGLYSFLGHKEIRFLFPAFPLFNLAAAVGLTRIHNLCFPKVLSAPSSKDSGVKKRPPVHIIFKLMFLGCFACLSLSLSASMIFLTVSRSNYPGGYALEELTNILSKQGDAMAEQRSVSVYIDVAAAMTGVSRFGQRAVQTKTPSTIELNFDKGGYEEENRASEASIDFSKYDFIITEDKDFGGSDFHVVSTVQGNPRFDFRRFRVTTTDAIFILQNDGEEHQTD